MDEKSFAQTTSLVRKAQGGHRESLDKLFERYLPRVRCIVAIRMGKPVSAMEDLEDLVQDSLLDAFRSLDRFQKSSNGTFCSWLARCVENNIKDHLRHHRAKKRGQGMVRPFADYGKSTLSASILEGQDPTPSQVAQGREMDEQIEKALLSMNERYREVLILRTVCQMSAKEAAEEMEMSSTENAQKLFERAKSKLMSLLET